MATAAPSTQTYTYQPGDTYWSLASNYGGGGVNWGQIQAANPNLNPATVQPGTTINLPANWNVNTSGTASPTNSLTGSVIPGYTPPAAIQAQPLNTSVPTNAGSALDVIAGQQGSLSSAYNTLLGAENATVPSLESAYNTEANQYYQDINTQEGINTQENQAATTAYNAATQGIQATAGVQQQQLTDQQNAAVGNAAASAGARGISSIDPFVQTLKAAAGQPYEEDLNQLNVQTQANLANEYATYIGQTTGYNIQTEQNIQQISDQIAQLAPAETQAIANINVQIAQTQVQQQQGLISNELSAYQIDTANQLKAAQIQATITAASIGAGATVQAAQVRGQVQESIAAGEVPVGTDKNGNTVYAPTLQAAQNSFDNAQKFVQSIINANPEMTGGLFGSLGGPGAVTGTNWGQVTNQLANYLNTAQQKNAANAKAGQAPAYQPQFLSYLSGVYNASKSAAQSGTVQTTQPINSALNDPTKFNHPNPTP